MPPVPEIKNERIAQNLNVISYQEAQKLAEEAAERATQRTISSLKPSTSIDEDINLDKEMRRAFYKKMTTPTFGELLSQQIDGQMASTFASKIMPNLFGSSSGEAVRKTGFMGAILDIMDTKFGGGLGEAVGNNMSDLIKTLGKEKVNQLIDSYTGNKNQEQQLTEEEQKKKIETTIMSLDSSNQEHILQFMQATGIKDYNQAQQVLLSEQNRILESRGLIKQVPKEDVKEIKKQDIRTSEDKKDINRELIQKYENPPDARSNSLQPSPFFDNSSPINSYPTDMSVGSVNGQTPEEVILSLNPDDPISLHTYSAMRKITGVDEATIKKLLMKEQRALLETINKSEQTKQSNKSDIDSQVSTGDKWEDNEIGKSMKKDEFAKEIGIKSREEVKTESQVVESTQNQELNVEKEPENKSPENVSMDIMNRIFDKLDDITKRLDILENPKEQLNKIEPTKVDGNTVSSTTNDVVNISNNKDIEESEIVETKSETDEENTETKPETYKENTETKTETDEKKIKEKLIEEIKEKHRNGLTVVELSKRYKFPPHEIRKIVR